ncbi:MAG: PEP-CTERM sorting domain-containing protein [Planctomycetota bacterium]
MKTQALVAALAATTLGASASASQILAFDNFGGDDSNLTSFIGEGVFGSPGDGFEEYDSGEGAPFTLIDSSAGTFPADTAGIIVEAPDGSFDPFFGAVDTVNGDTTATGGTVTAVWTFSVPGSQDIAVSFDLAAFGDFEDADEYTIEVGIDGSTLATFAAAADTDASLTYTLASGTTVDLDDPLTLDGVTLSNVFSNFSTGILGDGDEVTVSVTATLDGGSEGVALDNLTVTGVPEPATAALLGLGAAAMLRRRSA